MLEVSRYTRRGLGYSKPSPLLPVMPGVFVKKREEA